MTFRLRLAMPALGAGLALLGACRDADEPLLSPDGGVRAAAAAGAGVGRIRSEEAEFFALNAEIPGFGGYAYDADGNLVAFVKDLKDAGRAEARLQGRLQEFQGRSGGHRKDGRVQVRQGRFSFPELAAWRDVLSDSVLGAVPGVVSVDADEARNRVAVGVTGDGPRGEVMRRLARWRIPGDGVVVELAGEAEEIGPSTDLALDAPAGSLRSGTGALQAGRQITWYNWREAEWKVCTMGLTTTYGGVPSVVTNSHCSPTRATVEGTQYHFQRDRVVGVEVKDPGFGNNCDWMVWQKCRSADALIFQSNGYPVDRGKVARPLYRKTSNSSDYTAVQVDPAKPTMTITGTGDSRVGAIVDKVGRTTGWTYGVVKQTCVDVTVGANLGHKYRCQHYAKYRNEKGDSGSPVFYWNGDTVSWLGINWGTRWDVWELEYVSIYSPDGRVFEDLGTLPVTAPPPPPPFGAYIAGHDMPPVTSWQTYSASVTSGVPPYAYLWTHDGAQVGTSSSYSLNVGYDPFVLGLRVTDSTGAVVNASLYVSPWQSNCGTHLVCIEPL